MDALQKNNFVQIQNAQNSISSSFQTHRSHPRTFLIVLVYSQLSLLNMTNVITD